MSSESARFISEHKRAANNKYHEPRIDPERYQAVVPELVQLDGRRAKARKPKSRYKESATSAKAMKLVQPTSTPAPLEAPQLVSTQFSGKETFVWNPSAAEDRRIDASSLSDWRDFVRGVVGGAYEDARQAHLAPEATNANDEMQLRIPDTDIDAYALQWLHDHNYDIPVARLRLLALLGAGNEAHMLAVSRRVVSDSKSFGGRLRQSRVLDTAAAPATNGGQGAMAADTRPRRSGRSETANGVAIADDEGLGLDLGMQIQSVPALQSRAGSGSAPLRLLVGMGVGQDTPTSTPGQSPGTGTTGGSKPSEVSEGTGGAGPVTSAGDGAMSAVVTGGGSGDFVAPQTAWAAASGPYDVHNTSRWQGVLPDNAGIGRVLDMRRQKRKRFTSGGAAGGGTDGGGQEVHGTANGTSNGVAEPVLSAQRKQAMWSAWSDEACALLDASSASWTDLMALRYRATQLPPVNMKSTSTLAVIARKAANRCQDLAKRLKPAIEWRADINDLIAQGSGWAYGPQVPAVTLREFEEKLTIGRTLRVSMPELDHTKALVQRMRRWADRAKAALAQVAVASTTGMNRCDRVNAAISLTNLDPTSDGSIVGVGNILKDKSTAVAKAASMSVSSSSATEADSSTPRGPQDRDDASGTPPVVVAPPSCSSGGGTDAALGTTTRRSARQRTRGVVDGDAQESGTGISGTSRRTPLYTPPESPAAVEGVSFALLVELDREADLLPAALPEKALVRSLVGRVRQLGERAREYFPYEWPEYVTGPQEADEVGALDERYNPNRPARYTHRAATEGNTQSGAEQTTMVATSPSTEPSASSVVVESESEPVPIRSVDGEAGTARIFDDDNVRAHQKAIGQRRSRQTKTNFLPQLQGGAATAVNGTDGTGAEPAPPAVGTEQSAVLGPAYGRHGFAQTPQALGLASWRQRRIPLVVLQALARELAECGVYCLEGEYVWRTLVRAVAWVQQAKGAVRLRGQLGAKQLKETLDYADHIPVDLRDWCRELSQQVSAADDHLKRIKGLLPRVTASRVSRSAAAAASTEPDDLDAPLDLMTLDALLRDINSDTDDRVTAGWRRAGDITRRAVQGTTPAGTSDAPGSAVARVSQLPDEAQNLATVAQNALEWVNRVRQLLERGPLAGVGGEDEIMVAADAFSDEQLERQRAIARIEAWIREGEQLVVITPELAMLQLELRVQQWAVRAKELLSTAAGGTKPRYDDVKGHLQVMDAIHADADALVRDASQLYSRREGGVQGGSVRRAPSVTGTTRYTVCAPEENQLRRVIRAADAWFTEFQSAEQKRVSVGRLTELLQQVEELKVDFKAYVRQLDGVAEAAAKWTAEASVALAALGHAGAADRSGAVALDGKSEAEPESAAVAQPRVSLVRLRGLVAEAKTIAAVPDLEPELSAIVATADTWFSRAAVQIEAVQTALEAQEAASTATDIMADTAETVALRSALATLASDESAQLSAAASRAGRGSVGSGNQTNRSAGEMGARSRRSTAKPARFSGTGSGADKGQQAGGGSEVRGDEAGDAEAAQMFSLQECEALVEQAAQLRMACQSEVAVLAAAAAAVRAYQADAAQAAESAVHACHRVAHTGHRVVSLQMALLRLRLEVVARAHKGRGNPDGAKSEAAGDDDDARDDDDDGSVEGDDGSVEGGVAGDAGGVVDMECDDEDGDDEGSGSDDDLGPDPRAKDGESKGSRTPGRGLSRRTQADSANVDGVSTRRRQSTRRSSRSRSAAGDAPGKGHGKTRSSNKAPAPSVVSVEQHKALFAQLKRRARRTRAQAVRFRIPSHDAIIERYMRALPYMPTLEQAISTVIHAADPPPGICDAQTPTDSELQTLCNEAVNAGHTATQADQAALRGVRQALNAMSSSASVLGGRLCDGDEADVDDAAASEPQSPRAHDIERFVDWLMAARGAFAIVIRQHVWAVEGMMAMGAEAAHVQAAAEVLDQSGAALPPGLHAPQLSAVGNDSVWQWCDWHPLQTSWFSYDDELEADSNTPRGVVATSSRNPDYVFDWCFTLLNDDADPSTPACASLARLRSDVAECLCNHPRRTVHHPQPMRNAFPRIVTDVVAVGRLVTARLGLSAQVLPFQTAAVTADSISALPRHFWMTQSGTSISSSEHIEHFLNAIVPALNVQLALTLAWRARVRAVLGLSVQRLLAISATEDSTQAAAAADLIGAEGGTQGADARRTWQSVAKVSLQALAGAAQLMRSDWALASAQPASAAQRRAATTTSVGGGFDQGSEDAELLDTQDVLGDRQVMDVVIAQYCSQLPLPWGVLAAKGAGCNVSKAGAGVDVASVVAAVPAVADPGSAANRPGSQVVAAAAIASTGIVVDSSGEVQRVELPLAVSLLLTGRCLAFDPTFDAHHTIAGMGSRSSAGGGLADASTPPHSGLSTPQLEGLGLDRLQMAVSQHMRVLAALDRLSHRIRAPKQKERQSNELKRTGTVDTSVNVQTDTLMQRLARDSEKVTLLEAEVVLAQCHALGVMAPDTADLTNEVNLARQTTVAIINDLTGVKSTAPTVSAGPLTGLARSSLEPDHRQRTVAELIGRVHGRTTAVDREPIVRQALQRALSLRLSLGPLAEVLAEAIRARCMCHQPARDVMVACAACGDWYHDQCVHAAASREACRMYRSRCNVSVQPGDRHAAGSDSDEDEDEEERWLAVMTRSEAGPAFMDSPEAIVQASIDSHSNVTNTKTTFNVWERNVETFIADGATAEQGGVLRAVQNGVVVGETAAARGTTSRRSAAKAVDPQVLSSPSQPPPTTAAHILNVADYVCPACAVQRMIRRVVHRALQGIHRAVRRQAKWTAVATAAVNQASTTSSTGTASGVAAGGTPVGAVVAMTPSTVTDTAISVGQAPPTAAAAPSLAGRTTINHPTVAGAAATAVTAIRTTPADKAAAAAPIPKLVEDWLLQAAMALGANVAQNSAGPGLSGGAARSEGQLAALLVRADDILHTLAPSDNTSRLASQTLSSLLSPVITAIRALLWSRSALAVLLRHKIRAKSPAAAADANRQVASGEDPSVSSMIGLPEFSLSKLQLILDTLRGVPITCPAVVVPLRAMLHTATTWKNSVTAALKVRKSRDILPLQQLYEQKRNIPCDMPEEGQLEQVLLDRGTLYCICEGWTSGFMISCDFCSKWFHGECVGVTEQAWHRIQRVLQSSYDAVQDVRKETEKVVGSEVTTALEQLIRRRNLKAGKADDKAGKERAHGEDADGSGAEGSAGRAKGRASTRARRSSRSKRKRGGSDAGEEEDVSSSAASDNEIMDAEDLAYACGRLKTASIVDAAAAAASRVILQQLYASRQLTLPSQDIDGSIDGGISTAAAATTTKSGTSGSNTVTAPALLAQPCLDEEAIRTGQLRFKCPTCCDREGTKYMFQSALVRSGKDVTGSQKGKPDAPRKAKKAPRAASRRGRGGATGKGRGGGKAAASSKAAAASTAPSTATTTITNTTTTVGDLTVSGAGTPTLVQHRPTSLAPQSAGMGTIGRTIASASGVMGGVTTMSALLAAPRPLLPSTSMGVALGQHSTTTTAGVGSGTVVHQTPMNAVIALPSGMPVPGPVINSTVPFRTSVANGPTIMGSAANVVGVALSQSMNGSAPAIRSGTAVGAPTNTSAVVGGAATVITPASEPVTSAGPLKRSRHPVTGRTGGGSAAADAVNLPATGVVAAAASGDRQAAKRQKK